MVKKIIKEKKVAKATAAEKGGKATQRKKLPMKPPRGKTQKKTKVPSKKLKQKGKTKKEYYTLEVPVDSFENAIIASKYAERLEVCDDLASDGWTPDLLML